MSSNADDSETEPVSLRDGETRDDSGHARRTAAFIRDARRALDGEEQPETCAEERDQVKDTIDSAHDEDEDDD